MNEIWLVYRERDYTYDISNIVSFANYEEEADKQIYFCENICKEDPKIDVKEKLDEIRKSFEHILDDCDYRTLVTDAQTEYINTIPFEEYLKYKCGKNAKFNKTTIQRSV